MEKMQKTELGTKSIGKLLFSMTLPAITAQIINVLYNMVDSMILCKIIQGLVVFNKQSVATSVASFFGMHLGGYLSMRVET